MDNMSQARKPSVEQLRAQIEAGRYDVKPDRVAEAMLRRGIIFQAPPARPRD